MGVIRHFLRLYRAMSTSVVEAFCFSNPLINAGLHLLCLPFILELTRLGIKMEAMIERDDDLKGASEWLLTVGAAGVHIQGAERVPNIHSDGIGTSWRNS